MRNKSKIRPLAVITLALFAAAGIALVIFIRPEEPTAKETISEMLVTAGELINSYEENEGKANEKYLNKIISVTGLVHEVRQDENNVQSLLIGEKSAPKVISTFFKKDRPPAGSIKPGQEIVIKGLCGGLLYDIILTNCVIQKSNS